MLAKKNPVCRNSNLSVQRKNVKKNTLEQLVCHFLWTLTKETCIFIGKFLAGLSKLLSMCPEKQLQSNISEMRSWNLEGFWMVFEDFGTMAEIFFRVGKAAKDVRGNSLWKIFFQMRKIRYFFRFWAVFLLLAKKFARFAKIAIYVSVEVFGEKHFLKFI